MGISPGGFKGGSVGKTAGLVCRCQQLRSWGRGVCRGESSLPPISALFPTPSWVDSELPRRPLTPGLHNFQGMSQISGSSWRHLKEERKTERTFPTFKNRNGVSWWWWWGSGSPALCWQYPELQVESRSQGGRSLLFLTLGP